MRVISLKVDSLSVNVALTVVPEVVSILMHSSYTLSFLYQHPPGTRMMDAQHKESNMHLYFIHLMFSIDSPGLICLVFSQR